tara:strand:- start:581 stop:997 length:417 start_codon:yes stop_codon:yes gene_type:complete
MPLSSAQKMKNTQKFREDLMKDRMNRDELDLRTARLEPPIARIPIAYASSVSNKSVKPPQRDLLKEISVCRAENTQLRNLLEKRSRMLSTSISVMEQNGIRIPAGAKKFKKTMKKKKSMKKPKSRGKTRRNMSRRRRR